MTEQEFKDKYMDDAFYYRLYLQHFATASPEETSEHNDDTLIICEFPEGNFIEKYGKIRHMANLYLNNNSFVNQLDNFSDKNNKI